MTRERREHRAFADIVDYVRDGDVLVLNETRVIAARLTGTRRTGGAIELLLLHPAGSLAYDPKATTWLALARPAKRARIGERIAFGDLGTAEVVGEGEDGLREVRFDLSTDFETFLERAGRLPLPPYIRNDSQEAQDRYQTVFAARPGSVAAPTASLHFTAALLDEIAARGVSVVKLTLDVGLGTFRPMTGERLDEHRMHAERYTIPQNVVDAIAAARERGGRVIAAGTTVMRALEGNIRDHGRLVAGSWATEIFIRPGFTFRAVDMLITNFHLPQSTLLVLVSAFAGRERILEAYREAVERRYRFFSFGDAMLIERAEPAVSASHQ